MGSHRAAFSCLIVQSVGEDFDTSDHAQQYSDLLALRFLETCRACFELSMSSLLALLVALHL
jgi:hypothetical protein